MRTEQILDFVSGPEVLDVGCAGHEVKPHSPNWLHGQLRQHFRVTGIDISKDNIQQMRSLGFDDLHAQSAETFELPKQFDTIVAGELIEHLSNPGRFLQQARKHLNQDGRLVLSTPYPFSLMYGAYAAYHYPKTCQNDQHTVWFCPSTLTELASREGFEVESWHLTEDYEPSVSSLKYRAYWFIIRAIRAFLPERFYKTNMIFVLRPMRGGFDAT